MKKLFSFFILIILSFAYVSCAPETDFNGDLLFGVNNQGGTSGGNAAATNLLKKVTTTNADGTVTTQDYFYEDNALMGVNINDDGDMSTVLVIYDGKQIARLLTNSSDGTDLVSTNTTLKYTNSVLTGASSITTSAGNEVNKSESTYTYTLSKLSNIKTVISAQEQSGSYTPFSTNSTDVTFTGSNISAYKSTLTFAPIPGSPIQIPPVIVEANLSAYDAKRNPFATLPKEFTIAQADALQGAISVTGLSANNYGKATAVAGGVPSEVNFTYEYNTDGYPKKATSSGATSVFEYVN